MDFGWHLWTALCIRAALFPRFKRWVPVMCGAFASVGITTCVFAPSRFSSSRELDLLFGEVAQAAGVDPRLLRAIAEQESGLDPQKQKDGGYGLMQLGAETGAAWASTRGIESFLATDLLDARTNLQAGAWYLSRILRRYAACDDPVVFALAEYVAGPDAVARWANGSDQAAELLRRMASEPEASFVSGVLARYR